MNNSRFNCIFLQTITGHNKTENPQCFVTPEALKCSTLDCVLITLMTNEMLQIDLIYVSGIINFKNETIFIPSSVSAVPRNISIVCLDSCVVNSNETIFTKSFQRNFVLQLDGILFLNSTLSLGNMNMVFNHVTFVDSSLMDHASEAGDLGQIELHLLHTSFHCASGQTICGISMTKVFTASISVMGSELINFASVLSVPNLFCNFNHVSCIGCWVLLDNAVLSFVILRNSYFAGTNTSLQDDSTLQVFGYKVNVELTNCSFDNTAGFELIQKDSGLFDSWVQIHVQNCAFKQCSKLGSGGAISLTYVPPRDCPSKLSHFLKIMNSTFTQNEAVRIGQSVSQGGALSVINEKKGGTCCVLHLTIECSSFINNKATDGGGALFISGDCLLLTVSNSTFEVTDNAFDSPQGVFIISNSGVSLVSSSFSRFVKHQSPALIELEMLSEMDTIGDLDITLQCPAWHKVTLETKFVQHQARKIKAVCASCSASFYVPTDGHFTISLTSNQSSVHVTSGTRKADELNCTPCPAGAHCPGNDLIASPNFWGLRSESGIEMYQCPAEYCCAVNCTHFNQCLGHRTGVLCGSCELDHSLSLLSSECIHKSSCNDHWLWPVVILAMVLYMLWFTFKDDIFAIAGRVFKLLQKLCTKSGESQENNNIDKGYFGIVTYFVQVKAVLMLSKPEDITRALDKLFLEIESHIELVLNFELTYFSSNRCAVEHVTATRKTFFQFCFLFGVYLSWNLFFILIFLFEHFSAALNWKTAKFVGIKLKLISGFIEIMKYTYLGLTSIVFYSLVCISVGGTRVWLYDGSVLCYSKWQIAMMAFGLTYVLPYPLLFGSGMKLIVQKRISRQSFFLACCFPFPLLLYWQFVISKRKVDNYLTSHQALAGLELTICDGIRGGFRESEEGTQYWESVLMFRRLFISMTILISSPTIRLSVSFALCFVCVLHHAYRSPFVHIASNRAETFSLSLLCGIAAINLYKASFVYTDFNADSPQVEVMRNLQLFETMCVVLLIVFIVLCEAAGRVGKCVQTATEMKTQVIHVSPAFQPQGNSQATA